MCEAENLAVSICDQLSSLGYREKQESVRKIAAILFEFAGVNAIQQKDVDVGEDYLKLATLFDTTWIACAQTNHVTTRLPDRAPLKVVHTR